MGYPIATLIWLSDPFTIGLVGQLGRAVWNAGQCVWLSGTTKFVWLVRLVRIRSFMIKRSVLMLCNLFDSV